MLVLCRVDGTMYTRFGRIRPKNSPGHDTLSDRQATREFQKAVWSNLYEISRNINDVSIMLGKADPGEDQPIRLM